MMNYIPEEIEKIIFSFVDDWYGMLQDQWPEKWCDFDYVSWVFFFTAIFFKIFGGLSDFGTETPPSSLWDSVNNCLKKNL